MKNIYYIGGFLIAIAILASITYGCYWIVKTVSYSLFYEDMVRQTIIDMVNESALK